MQPPDAGERPDSQVDLSNVTDVRHWAGRLMVTEPALRALASVHGTRIADLRKAIDNATKTETSRIFPPAPKKKGG